MLDYYAMQIDIIKNVKAYRTKRYNKMIIGQIDEGNTFMIGTGERLFFIPKSKMLLDYGALLDAVDGIPVTSLVTMLRAEDDSRMSDIYMANYQRMTDYGNLLVFRADSTGAANLFINEAQLKYNLKGCEVIYKYDMTCKPGRSPLYQYDVQMHRLEALYMPLVL